MRLAESKHDSAVKYRQCNAQMVGLTVALGPNRGAALLWRQENFGRIAIDE
jgi:hypothetical protein